MGNKQGSLGHHLDTASKTGALAFPSKVSYCKKLKVQLSYSRILIIEGHCLFYTISFIFSEIRRVSRRLEQSFTDLTQFRPIG